MSSLIRYPSRKMINAQAKKLYGAKHLQKGFDCETINSWSIVNQPRENIHIHKIKDTTSVILIHVVKLSRYIYCSQTLDSKSKSQIEQAEVWILYTLTYLDIVHKWNCLPYHEAYDYLIFWKTKQLFIKIVRS